MVSRKKVARSARSSSKARAPERSGRGRSASPKSEWPKALPVEGYADSFFRLRRSEPGEEVPEVDVVLQAIPLRAGQDARISAVDATHEVRRASSAFGGFCDALGVEVQAEVQAVDGGDLLVSTPGATALLDAVTARAEHVARSGVIGGYVCGEGLATLGVLRGIHKAKLKPVGLIHIDAARDPLAGSLVLRQPSEATSLGMVSQALREGLINPAWSMQIGARGPFATASELGILGQAGIEVAKTDDVRRDLYSVISSLRKVAVLGTVYVTVDLSVLDPAFAPAALHPKPGGLSTWELQQVLRALVGANIIGFDVVGMRRDRDLSGITALAAASCLFDLLSVIADTRRSSLPTGSRSSGRRDRRISP